MGIWNYIVAILMIKEKNLMKILFCIALIIIICGAVNYRKMSYKANYLNNKESNTGYYWGGIPREEK